jgi:serine/threonine protein kinase
VTRYELLDRIGVGGMAEIFRGKAVAAGGFEKPVAIKRILPHLSADQRFVELLIAEAKILSQLRHRNIVQIFDVGLGDDGKYFLVMEFVDGKDLLAIKTAFEERRQRLPLDIVLHIGAELCDALGHAHAAKGADGTPMKLVHRDISPSNILISRAGEVKLTDFGIAKRAEESTGHGGVRGKFAYISPEQARNEHLDPRSDVFSAGLLLWELFTGKPLFSAMSDLEALRSVREAQVPRPSTVDPTLPPELDTILMTALAAEPARRYAGALQFGSKLRTLRYSLDEASGDPAAELARAVEVASLKPRVVSKAPPRGEFDGGEVTVIRIHTADAFATGGNDVAALSRARQVIERFEEEETRMSQLGQIKAQLGRSRNFATSDEATISAHSNAKPPRNEFFNDERTALAPAGMVEQLRAASEVDELDEIDLVQDEERPAQKKAELPPPKLAKVPNMERASDGPKWKEPAAAAWSPPMPRNAAAPGPTGYEFNPPTAPPRRAASPTLRDAHEPHYMPTPLPDVHGFESKNRRGGTLLFGIVAIAVIAALAFAITRAVVKNNDKGKAPTSQPP